MASSTRTASASGSHGPTSKPACSGWSVASDRRDGQNSTTGIAKRAAKSASAEKLRSVPSPRPQMIKGRFARARMAAASAIPSGAGAGVAAGLRRGVALKAKSDKGAASASRGRLR